MTFELKAGAVMKHKIVNNFISIDLKLSLLEIIVDANVAAVIDFIVVRMTSLMSHQSNLVDESWRVRADEAFMDFLTVVMVDHVLLEVSLVSKDFPAESAGHFIDDMSVAKVIFHDTFCRVILVANVAGKKLSQFGMFQLDVSPAVAVIEKLTLKFS